MKYVLLYSLSIFLLFGCKAEYSETTTQPTVTLPEIVVSPTEAPQDPTEVAQTVPEVIEAPGHEASTPIGPEYPVKDVKKIFTVKITATNYFPAELEKLHKAEGIIERVINSEDYKKEVLSRKFTNTLGLTNQQIYEKLFSGAEALIPALNYQMDLTVEGYHSWTNTVGYTTAKTMKVYTNRKYHNKYTPCQVASNLTHEWTHKMGFDHSSAGDSLSVPYSHNAILESLCVKFSQEN